MKRRVNKEIAIPDGMTLEQAAAQLNKLTREAKRGEEEAVFVHSFDAFVWDGAAALNRAIIKLFGTGFGESIETIFGKKLPHMVEVATGPRAEDRVMVPVGNMTLPGIEGEIASDSTVESGRFVFKLVATVKRKYEADIQELADAVREELAAGSIYRGKAIKVDFTNKQINPWSGEEIPNAPEFLALGGVGETSLILNRDVMAAVQTSLFTPIDRREDLNRLGMGGKRGVLLAGTYGTGKTLTALVAAAKAQAAGTTFLLCEDAAHFAEAVSFAKMYAPAVVFCEDIDRALQGGRTAQMDTILNTVDGIESKAVEVMVVLTTNNIDAIHPAALRPGRFDAVVDFALPDAEATERLIRLYAGEALAPDVDIRAAAEVLAGNVPAVIAEALRRAKLAQVKLSPRGVRRITITPEAMVDAVQSMAHQMELLNRPRVIAPTELEKAMNVFSQIVVDGLRRAARYTEVHTSEETLTALGEVKGEEKWAIPAVAGR